MCIEGQIVLRPLRASIVEPGRESAISTSTEGAELALNQEVIWRRPRYVERGLVYPPGGWSKDVKIYSVNAGEVADFVLETGGSIISIDTPRIQSMVLKNEKNASVYSIVGDDGIIIQPDQWEDQGGKLEVSVTEDRTGINLHLEGATGIARADGKLMQNFRVGVSSGTSTDNTYSTLRIVGEFVELTENTLTLPTGVPEWMTAQEQAPTIDNPFLATLSSAYAAGIRGAANHAGRVHTITMDTLSMKRAIQPAPAGLIYKTPQIAFENLSYESVDEFVFGDTPTYSSGQAFLTNNVRNADGPGEVSIGEIVGARIWDEDSRRYYRVRDATISRDIISIEGDDDLLIGDLDKRFDGMTMGQVDALYAGYNMEDGDTRGIPE